MLSILLTPWAAHGCAGLRYIAGCDSPFGEFELERCGDRHHLLFSCFSRVESAPKYIREITIGVLVSLRVKFAKSLLLQSWRKRWQNVSSLQYITIVAA